MGLKLLLFAILAMILKKDKTYTWNLLSLKEPLQAKL